MTREKKDDSQSGAMFLMLFVILWEISNEKQQILKIRVAPSVTAGASFCRVPSLSSLSNDLFLL